jgi:hypothetical protein
MWNYVICIVKVELRRNNPSSITTNVYTNFLNMAHHNCVPRCQDMPAYVITPDRLDFIRGQKMYPFFDKGGNDGNGDFQVGVDQCDLKLGCLATETFFYISHKRASFCPILKVRNIILHNIT